MVMACGTWQLADATRAISLELASGTFPLQPCVVRCGLVARAVSPDLFESQMIPEWRVFAPYGGKEESRGVK